MEVDAGPDADELPATDDVMDMDSVLYDAVSHDPSGSGARNVDSSLPPITLVELQEEWDEYSRALSEVPRQYRDEEYYERVEEARSVRAELYAAALREPGTTPPERRYPISPADLAAIMGSQM